MFVRVSSLTQLADTTIRNIGSVTFDGNAPEESSIQKWPLQTGHYKAYLIDPNPSVFRIYGESDTFSVVLSNLSTNKLSYYFNESITFSWMYNSKYTGTGANNSDALVIYDSTVINIGVAQPTMFVWVSTLSNGNNFNTTIRNNGTVTFDNQPPDESFLHSWPSQFGSYKAYIFDASVNNGGNKYAERDIFVVVPEISTNKQSYYVNESITISWLYKSNHTAGNLNYDIIGIYNPATTGIGLSRPILFVWVGALSNSNITATIRESGFVTFDSQPPDKTGSGSWPLPVGSYKAVIVNYQSFGKYAESDTFVVVPATASPTMAPTKQPTKEPTKEPTIAPTKAPTIAPVPLSSTTPTIAPVRKRKQFFCNVFLLRYIFCSVRCGLIGRLLNTC